MIEINEVLNKITSDFNLDDTKLNQLKIYFEFLVSENEKYNLTNITAIDEVYIKHFYDSMLVSKYHNLENLKICDIGAGAGFPSIPLKILVPSIELTIIEPTQKRCNFLSLLCEKLGIKVTILAKRSEDIANDYRECFDVCLARAVANLSVLLELCISYVKVNGKFISLKGSNYNEELAQAAKAIKTLELKYNAYEYELPFDFGSRSIIKFDKSKPTNKKYPRRYSQIKQKPL